MKSQRFGFMALEQKETLQQTVNTNMYLNLQHMLHIRLTVELYSLRDICD